MRRSSLTSQYYYGIIEDARSDPYKLGRCKVRIIGLHNENRSELPTEDLPWAVPVQPIYSAAVNGIGHSPTGLVEGAWVICVFTEEDQQTPLILGTVASIPSSKEAFVDDIEAEFDGQEPQVPSDQIYVQTGSGGILTDSQGAPVTVGQTEPGEKYLGSLTKDQYDRLKQRIGERESSNNYRAVNQYNYLGKYQFGAARLVDMGYIRQDYQRRYGNSAVNYPEAWTGKDGISSKDDFLGAPVVQEQVMDRSLRNSYQSIVNGSGVDGSAADPGRMGGLLYLAHNQGNTTAVRFLNSGGHQQTADGNGQTSVRAYEIGYEGVTGGRPQSSELPTRENIAERPAVNPNPNTSQDARRYDTTQAPEVRRREVQSIAKAQAGFNDPNGKYPKQQFMNEPDTNRLARHQKIDKTIVGTKEKERVQKVPVANSSVTWSQPPIPYNARYPYNHVTETESGHILELDDTPDRERINIHHKSGTFTEIDVTGTRTTKVKGSEVIIIEKDQLVYIVGSGHVMLGGDLSIKVIGNCNIDVTGDASMHVGGSMYSEVDGDYNMKVGGAYKVTSGQSTSFTPGEDFNVDTGAAVFMNSGKSESPDNIPSYSPEILLPEPFTRHEEQDIVLENTPEMARRREEDARTVPPPVVQQQDTTPPPPREPVVSECEFILPISLNTQLSANYKIRDMITGSHRFPFGGSQRGLSDVQIACNLKHLCMNVMEPLLEKYAQHGLTINSGFRNGSGTSQHEVGQAVDIGFSKYRGNRQKYYEFAQEIKNLVPHDQFLLEYTDAGSVWIHISFKKEGNRASGDQSKVMTFNNHKRVAYGLQLLSRG